MAGLLVGCEDNTFQAPPPPQVTVAPPVQRDVTQYAEFTGTTHAFKAVEVRARVQGILEEVSYTVGEQINEGDALFRIDPRPFVAARDASQAKVMEAQAQAQLADTTAKRVERSASEGAISELQALESRAQADAAAAMLEVAKKDLAIKQLDVDYTDVRAPIAGRVARNNFSVGSFVGGNDSALLTTIYDDSKIYAWFSVPDRIFLQARPDERKASGEVPPIVELATEVDEGFPHAGQIDYGDPTIDSETGTLRVRAVFDNDDRALVAGLFVRCRFAVGVMPQALLVPETAIGADQVGSYLLVVDGQGKVERRNIELGPLDDGLRVISSGLNPDDNVIVRGLLRARPGATVNAQPAGPPPAQAQEAGS